MSLRMKRKAPASSPGGEDVKVETFVHDDFAGRYDGEADDEGRPHGVGILRLDDDGAWYQGEFRHGAKHGQGTLHFPPDDDDEDDDDDDDDDDKVGSETSLMGLSTRGDRVRGSFADDCIEGYAEYLSRRDGTRRAGLWHDGELSGLIEEFDDDGECVFGGEMDANGHKNGRGWFTRPDGGCYGGELVDGEPHGKGLYLFPLTYGVCPPESKKDAATFAFWGMYESQTKEWEEWDARRDQHELEWLKVADGKRCPTLLAAKPDIGNDWRNEKPGPWSEDPEMCGDDPEPPAGMTTRMCLYGDWLGGKCVRCGFFEGTAFWKEHFWAQPHLSPVLADIFMCFFEEGDTAGHGEERYAIAKAAGMSMRDEFEKFQLYDTAEGYHMPQEGPWGVVRNGANTYDGQHPRDFEPNELIGFVTGRRRALRGWGERRWLPSDKVFYLGDDEGVPDPPPEGSGADPEPAGQGAGGVFIIADDVDHLPGEAKVPDYDSEADEKTFLTNIDVPLTKKDGTRRRIYTTLGEHAKIAQGRDPPNSERKPYVHPVLGNILALVATRKIIRDEDITVPPCYETGWRLNPKTEAGYYHHLKNTPPVELFESGRAGESGKVYVRAHGPWRALWLDKVEQGLAYDFNAGANFANDPSAGNFTHDPTTIGFEYVRAMATSAVAAIHLRGRLSNPGKTRVLCVGLGAGTLPAFLRHAFPSLDVLCAEIERDVADAAANFMGVKFEEVASEDALDAFNEAAVNQSSGGDGSLLEKTPFRLVVEDAAEFLDKDECVGAFDLVLLDAYDGAGRVPAHLRDANLGFVGKLVRSLRSPGGFVVANLWNSEDRVEFSRERRELEEFRAQLSTAGASSRVDVKVRGQEGNVVVLASTDTMGGNEALLTSLRGVLEAHPGIATSLVPPEHFAASEPY